MWGKHISQKPKSTLGQFIGTKHIAYSNGKSINIVLYALKRMCMNFKINL
jgi:hypothetical protein